MDELKPCPNQVRHLLNRIAELERVLKNIQEMAEEDLRMDLGGTNMHQIEADARAAIGESSG